MPHDITNMIDGAAILRARLRALELVSGNLPLNGKDDAIYLSGVASILAEWMLTGQVCNEAGVKPLAVDDVENISQQRERVGSVGVTEPLLGTSDAGIHVEGKPLASEVFGSHLNPPSGVNSATAGQDGGAVKVPPSASSAVCHSDAGSCISHPSAATADRAA